MTGKVQKVPFAILRKSPQHFDRDFSTESVEALADSIERCGLLHYPTARKNGRMFEYLTGERRIQALKMLGHKSLPCLVVSCDDTKAREISLVENLRISNLSTKESRQAVRELVDIVDKQLRFKKKDPDRMARFQAHNEVAKTINKDRRTVARIDKQRNLIDAALEAADDAKITQSQAEILSDLPKEKQVEELATMMLERQEETLQRHKERRYKASKDRVTITTKLFSRIQTDCGKLQHLISGFRNNLTDETLRAIRTMDTDAITHTQQALCLLMQDIESVDE